MTIPRSAGGDALALRLAPFVVEAARGDAAAFGTLVTETRGLVCAITLAMTRDVPTSEDVAQEVYVHAWRSLPKLRSATSFLPWLRELARNRARMALRAAGRRRRREEVPADDTVLALAADPAGDALDAVLDAEARRLLVEALAAVPDAAREVLVLYYREGQSVRQVAALLELTEAAVKQRLARARRALRAEYLARAGETLERSAPGMAFVAAVTSAALAAALPGVASATTVAGGALALRTGAAAKLGGKLGVGAAAGATIAGGIAGLASGIIGLAVGRQRLLAAARSEAERRAIRRYAAVQMAALTAFMGALLFVRDPVLLTAAYAALLAHCAWIQFHALPRHRGEPVRRGTVIGFVAGAVLGALPFAWLWWRVLAR